MTIQIYIDCGCCGKRFVVGLVDYEKRTITLYPLDYFDKASGTTKIHKLYVKQDFDQKEHDQKIITIACPWCGNFSITNIPYDWIVEVGFIEILNSIPSYAVETIENVKDGSIIKGDFE